MAPKTTEDLPQELDLFVREAASKHGLECAIAINAHNSIENVYTAQNVPVENLRKLALQAIEKVLSGSHGTFKVGAYAIHPNGMGAGGIVAIVFEVAGQKTAYIVIDGNNMIVGLRERILEALSSEGFDQAEVFTTDTHAVSAVVLGKRGYYPVGEVMDQNILIQHIVSAARSADANLEPGKVEGQSIKIRDVIVIGENRLNTLSLLVDKAVRQAKYIVLPFFGIEALFLVLFLLLF